jgi:hypothetical protein
VSEIPPTAKILKIFEPITFPIEMSVFPRKPARKLVTNSGAEVPAAIMVAAMTLAGSPQRLAIRTEASTSLSPEKTRRAKPRMRKNKL